MRRFAVVPCLLVFLASASPLLAAAKTLHLQVTAPKQDRSHVPLKVNVSVPKELADASAAKLTVGGQQLWGQLTAPGLLADAEKAQSGEVARELHFVLPQLKAGSAVTIEAVISSDGPKPSQTFAWEKDEATHIDLTYAGKPVARYMKEAFDDSTAENRERTYKVYHHVFAPDGKTLLTKGPGGQYTHHRGIYYGFSKTSYGENLNKRADTWHCPGGVHQSHQEVLSSEAGPVLARHRLTIGWHGSDKQMFAKETRELTFYHTEAGLLVEFASKVQSLDGKLKLDGDPQHAGFQFRASNEVSAKTGGQTYYIRPDGIDKPGSFKQNQQQPWNAMSFVVADQRYTAGYLDHPDNPKPAYYSERNYGRFGSYFVAETEGDKTIDANYRLWIQPGEMTVEQVAAHVQNFVDPPEATVK